MNLLGGCKYKIYNMKILYLNPTSKFKIYNMTEPKNKIVNLETIYFIYLFFILTLSFYKAFVGVPVQKGPSCTCQRQRPSQISVLCDYSCVRVHVRLDYSDLRPSKYRRGYIRVRCYQRQFRICSVQIRLVGIRSRNR